jgi:hypothetical protein
VGPAPLTLDLAAVSFVGREGVDLLARLRRERVTLRNCFTADRRAAEKRGRRMDTESELQPDRAAARARRERARAAHGPATPDGSTRVAYGIHAQRRGCRGGGAGRLPHPVPADRRFEGRAALGSWLYRVTTNAALIKRRGKRAELEVSLEEQLPTYRADGHREGVPLLLLADWSRDA